MLKVFTNPVNEWVSIDLPSMPAEDYRISLVNPAGQVIRQVTLQGGRGVSLDLLGLALGKYIIQIYRKNFFQNLNLLKL